VFSPYRGFLTLEKWLNGIGAAVLVAMMLLVTANVACRYLLNKPILGTLEYTEFCMVAAVYLTLAYTQFLKAHINIELVLSILSHRRKLLCDLITYLCGFLFFGLIVWHGTRMTVEAYEIQEVTFGTTEAPIWPSKFLVPFGSLIVSIRFLLDAAQVAKELFRRGN
jgi:TRAP-type C4-dicarboxylate transport system permease small subunit